MSLSPSISRLSEEILVHIFTFLESYASTARLVQKSWARIGAEFLLRHVRLEHKSRASGGDALWAYPDLFRNVRSVTYARQNNGNHGFTIEDAKAVCNPVRFFSNLEAINVFCGTADGDEDYEEWDIGILEEFHGAQELETLQSSIKQPGKLRTVRVAFLDCQFFVRNSPDATAHLWSAVTNLELSLVRCPQRILQGGLRKTLVSVLRLRRLSIKFHPNAGDDVQHVLSDIAHPDSTWAGLRDLTLHGFMFANGDFKSRIFSTIHCLELGDIEFTEPSWLMILQNLELKHAHLCGVVAFGPWVWLDQALLRKAGEWLTNDPRLLIPCPLTLENGNE